MDFESGLIIYFVGMVVWAEILLSMLKKEKTRIPNFFVFLYNILLWPISILMFIIYSAIKCARS
ncbi:hypothetical protein APT65_00082 [Trabzonvirus APT65]|uniref:Uncharacterized protein n=1 Tax=Aeromonas phage APT65 TaxID=2982914 RepID=A0A9E8GHU4_9CAUD|nr:hypothetical protein APT65_00082 [Aeromonas phage APT65]